MKKRWKPILKIQVTMKKDRFLYYLLFKLNCIKNKTFIFVSIKTNN